MAPFAPSPTRQPATPTRARNSLPCETAPAPARTVAEQERERASIRGDTRKEGTAELPCGCMELATYIEVIVLKDRIGARCGCHGSA